MPTNTARTNENDLDIGFKSNSDRKYQTSPSITFPLTPAKIAHINKYGIKELERIFGINPNEKFNPKDAEGCLAEYADSESSVEWVRNVRDNP